jgi:hypothetical protein
LCAEPKSALSSFGREWPRLAKIIFVARQSSCGASHRIVSARIEKSIKGSDLVPDSSANNEMCWPAFVLAPTP